MPLHERLRVLDLAIESMELRAADTDVERGLGVPFAVRSRPKNQLSFDVHASDRQARRLCARLRVKATATNPQHASHSRLTIMRISRAPAGVRDDRERLRAPA